MSWNTFVNKKKQKNGYRSVGPPEEAKLPTFLYHDDKISMDLLFKIISLIEHTTPLLIYTGKQFCIVS